MYTDYVLLLSIEVDVRIDCLRKRFAVTDSLHYVLETMHYNRCKVITGVFPPQGSLAWVPMLT